MVTQDKNIQKLLKLYPIHIFLYLGIFWTIWCPLFFIFQGKEFGWIDLVFLILWPIIIFFYNLRRRMLINLYKEYITVEWEITDTNLISIIKGTRTLKFKYTLEGSTYTWINTIADYSRQTTYLGLKIWDKLQLIVSKSHPKFSRIISYEK